MDKRRVPNLEEMNEQQARNFLTELFSKLSAEEEYEIRHEEYVMEMPQSGESIRGPENMRAFQGSLPPATLTRRASGYAGCWSGTGWWVVEGVNDYGGGRIFTVVPIIELKDGKMFRDTRYYAEPFEAPEWRARLVERIET